MAYKKEYEEHLRSQNESISPSSSSPTTHSNENGVKQQDKKKSGDNGLVKKLLAVLKRNPNTKDNNKQNNNSNEGSSPFAKFNVEELDSICNQKLVNVYNKGVFHNFMEVLLPRYNKNLKTH